MTENPHEVMHPAWAGTEHIAWEDGYEAALNDVLNMIERYKKELGGARLAEQYGAEILRDEITSWLKENS